MVEGIAEKLYLYLGRCARVSTWGGEGTTTPSSPLNLHRTKIDPIFFAWDSTGELVLSVPLPYTGCVHLRKYL